MLLRRLQLDNVKCFARGTEIDFTLGRDSPHKWVVIYGDNGLGKSTLLKAIGIALTGQPALNALLPSAEGWVRGTQRRASVAATISKGPGDTSVGYPRQRPAQLKWTLVGRRATKIGGEPRPAGSILLTPGLSKEEKSDASLFRKEIASDDPGRGWLICGYGPHRRLTGAASDLIESISPDGRAARLVTLFHEKAALTSAERWLRDLQHQALEERSGRIEQQLDMIRHMINHGLLHNGVKLSRIAHDGVFFRTPFGKDIPMADLSDGYRTSLSLTLDLLRHVSRCFDVSLVLKESNGRCFVDAEASCSWTRSTPIFTPRGSAPSRPGFTKPFRACSSSWPRTAH